MLPPPTLITPLHNIKQAVSRSCCCAKSKRYLHLVRSVIVTKRTERAPKKKYLILSSNSPISFTKRTGMELLLLKNVIYRRCFLTQTTPQLTPKRNWLSVVFTTICRFSFHIRRRRTRFISAINPDIALKLSWEMTVSVCKHWCKMRCHLQTLINSNRIMSLPETIL